MLWAELPAHLKEFYGAEEELFEDYMRQSKDMDELLESDVARQAFRGTKRKHVLANRPSCHEQADGVILALSVLEVNVCECSSLSALHDETCCVDGVVILARLGTSKFAAVSIRLRLTNHKHISAKFLICSLISMQSFSKELLTAWIKYLETSNPHLSQIPVIFSLNSPPPSELVVQTDSADESDSAVAKNVYQIPGFQL